MSQKWKFILHPLTASYLKIISEYNLEFLGNISRYIDFKEEENIYTLVQTGRREQFKFLNGFDKYVWITILITIFFIPICMAIIEKTFSNYLSNFWNYSYFILSETIPRIPTNLRKRYILTYWLLSCTILLAAYGGVIKDIFLKPVPDVVVNSWNDLHQRKDLKIVTIEGSVIDNFVSNKGTDNEMARDFGSRLERIKFEDMNRNTEQCFFVNYFLVVMRSHISNIL